MTTGGNDRVELKTERLLLRPYRLEDVDDVYAYAKDPGWDWFLVPGSPQPYTRRNAEESVARRLTEAATAIVDWGFRELGLAKVYGNSDLRHVASWRVMEKIGMTREGVLRSHRRAREGRSDRVYYGILREDWEAAYADDSGGRR